MPRIFQKWPLSWNMLHIVYQHSWKFNLETLLMLRIYGKWLCNWKMLSTRYQDSKQINLISNFHNFILKLQKSSWNIVANVSSSKMTTEIAYYCYNLKFYILNNPFCIIFWISTHFDYKLTLYHVYYAFMPFIRYIYEQLLFWPHFQNP
jgi:hypothetical protein